MSYRNGSWPQRFGALGNAAEKAFEEQAPTGYVRFGLDRPPIQVSRLPARIRHAPDYLTSFALVECVGCGKDRIVRLKVEKLNCLQWWNGSVFPVELFVWNSFRKTSRQVPLQRIMWLVDQGRAEFGTFPEFKGFFGIKFEDLEDVE